MWQQRPDTRICIIAIACLFGLGIFINFSNRLPTKFLIFTNTKTQSDKIEYSMVDWGSTNHSADVADDLLAWSSSPEPILLQTKNIFFHHASESLINEEYLKMKWSSPNTTIIKDHFWNVQEVLKFGKVPEPNEKFTINIVTYNRIDSMLTTIRDLNMLQHLDKVIVLWNSPRAPNVRLDWPSIHVPIHVYLGVKNSLNNRFLPFDLIETNAVLSLDDDLALSHEEILFAFRVWRENQNHIVGFPGRSVGWNSREKKWTYEHSADQCMINFVLTGAAFVHKFYYYLYTYEMPQVIRDKVDELLNCEDLAMNFLVSNKTQMPPVKVTPKDDFHCLKCSAKEAALTLHDRPKHYEERSDCINFFASVYGYIPLFISETIAVKYIKGDPKCATN